MTVAYSDTFPVAGGCHCNRLDLYYVLILKFVTGQNWKIGGNSNFLSLSFPERSEGNEVSKVAVRR